MTFPAALRILRGMIRDTFRQSLASKVFGGLLAITLLATLVCLSIEVHGDVPRPGPNDGVPAFLPRSEVPKLGEDRVRQDGIRVVSGEVSLGFGLITVPLGRHRDDAVRLIQLLLAGGVADTLGILLAILWTAGFLPSFLEPQSATVMLAKPVPRWLLLLGKYLGVVFFVAIQATLFIALTWTALGLRTGVWNVHYWLAVPLLTLNFAILYAVSVFLGVATRNTITTLFGTLVVWLIAWTMNFAYLRTHAVPTNPASAPPAIAAAYWVLPKPVNLGALFYEGLQAEGLTLKVPELEAAQTRGVASAEWSIITSMLFAMVMLAAAAYEFHHTDY
jgi:ABC-type transport system involved in multi-copper enzyme maturation permease subunit